VCDLCLFLFERHTVAFLETVDALIDEPREVTRTTRLA
jgi:hypothetical protein